MVRPGRAAVKAKLGPKRRVSSSDPARWRRKSAAAANRRSERLNAEPLFQLPHAVAGDGELGLVIVFQAHEDAAVDGGKQLLDERDVDDRGAVDAREAPRIEPRLELA